MLLQSLEIDPRSSCTDSVLQTQGLSAAAALTGVAASDFIEV